MAETQEGLCRVLDEAANSNRIFDQSKRPPLIRTSRTCRDRHSCFMMIAMLHGNRYRQSASCYREARRKRTIPRSAIGIGATDYRSRIRFV